MTDRKDPFEEELREALRSEGDRLQRASGADDGDELLARVHRGASRRRRRRRTGALAATALLSSALLVTLPLLAPPPPTDESARNPTPGAAPTRTERVQPNEPERANERRRSVAQDGSGPSRPLKARGSGAALRYTWQETAVEAVDVKVTSVSATGDEELWLSGYGTCDGDRLCNVLGHSSNGGGDFEFSSLPGGAQSRRTTVRFSTDGTTGWATDGRRIFRTETSGGSWSQTRTPRDVSVSTLVTWENEVWAVGKTSSQETVILANQDGADQFVEVERSADLQPTGAVALGSRAFGVPRADSDRNFAHTSDGGSRWNGGDIGCEPADVSAKDDAAWALCGDFDGLARSFDQGKSWLPETLDATTVDASMKIAAIDRDTAFIAGSEGGWVVENRTATPVRGLGEGSYAYASFATDDVGHVIGDDGHLCRTTDGGYTWERVELP